MIIARTSLSCSNAFRLYQNEPFAEENLLEKSIYLTFPISIAGSLSRASYNCWYDTERNPVVLCDDCAYLLSETVVRYHWTEPEYEKVAPESKLWRYMDLSKFLSMIGKKTLYFASAESFEDIFEGAKGTLERKEKWDAFYLDFFREAIQTAPGMKPEDLTDEYIEENTTRLLSELNASGNARRKHTFISCWHCNESESEAMWKLYSTNVNNALAIQTTY